MDSETSRYEAFRILQQHYEAKAAYWKMMYPDAEEPVVPLVTVAAQIGYVLRKCAKYETDGKQFIPEPPLPF